MDTLKINKRDQLSPPELFTIFCRQEDDSIWHEASYETVPQLKRAIRRKSKVFFADGQYIKVIVTVYNTNLVYAKVIIKSLDDLRNFRIKYTKDGVFPIKTENCYS